MISEHVGDREAHEINKLVEKILLDLGNPEPPLSLEEVRYLLNLDLQYYSQSDPSHLDGVAHKIKISGKQIALRPGILIDVFKKLSLSALWVPDNKRILINEEVPKLKHRWIEGHEISHSFIPWHRDFLFGDNENSLSPACDEIIEAEANYASGRLLFLGKKFSQDSKDLDMNFKSIFELKDRYSNTITTTLWRMVEEREPKSPVFGMISRHPYYDDIGKTNERFIRSAGFRDRFSNVPPEDAYNLIVKHASRQKTGPGIIDAEDILIDVNGNPCVFRIESFCNSHDLLTYGVFIEERKLVF